MEATTTRLMELSPAAALARIREAEATMVTGVASCRHALARPRRTTGCGHRLLGHSDIRVTARYQHVLEETAKAAAEQSALCCGVGHDRITEPATCNLGNFVGIELLPGE